MKKLSHIEEQFALFVKLFRLPKPEREYRFDSVRRWRMLARRMRRSTTTSIVWVSYRARATSERSASSSGTFAIT